jgi:hypothetical protein
MTLPTDLERLGNHLEVAALRAVRRRARRRVLLNALCALAVIIPVAIAVSATNGARSVRAPLRAPAPAPTAFALWAPARAADIAVHRIPDVWLPPAPKPACIDGNDCDRPAPPTRLMNYPDPARRA